MNNNLCQFYVVFGNKNFESSNNKVYINANNINNLKELSDKIISTYKEKAKLGFKVGSEIIFLIPNEKYRQKTEEIIKQLKVNGKIEVMEPIKSKTPETFSGPLPPPPLEMKVSEKKEEKTIEINAFPQKLNKIEEKNITSEENLNTKEENKAIEKKEEDKTPVYQPNDNIYRGTIDSTTYTNFNKPKKKNNLALIIFIISLIFFIISLILLFVM